MLYERSERAGNYGGSCSVSLPPILSRAGLTSSQSRRKGVEVIDLHCHILPGLDDGPQDWEESVQMARMAIKDSISGIVCTPHLTPVYPENDRAAILASLEQFRSRLEQAHIPLELYPGAELAIDPYLPERIDSGEIMSINDTRCFALIEMPVEIIPPHLDRFFWSMQSKGVGIVLAHPERNSALMKDKSLLFKWVSAGVLVQITASSLEGEMGRSTRDFAIGLLERRMVHVVDSDSHGPTRRRPALSAARAVVESVIGKEEADKIFYDNPRRLLAGVEPDCAPPLLQSPGKTSFLKRLLPFRK